MIKKTLLLVMFIIMVGLLSGCSGTFDKEKEYTTEMILARCGFEGVGEFSDDGRTFNYQLINRPDYDYISILNRQSKYRGYTFYVFPSESAAKKEFLRNKKEKYEADEFEYGKNYLSGWQAGVMDASIRSFEYLTKNIIVEVNEESLGSDFDSQEDWQKWHDEYFSNEAKAERKKDRDQMHKKVMSEW